ncbi:energy-coupling factor transporter transmembrane protein EcfT [uncultured Corynebacterium sp.]|uniref:energy-coupling factor transporter transmembrane component T family protein n=1 Tax=uncultured Corynebacterium sp. TaxID=159447 RepID=UPI002602D11F|nr:energy-coupling factor transporter transmembrane protein EcfT [uncultured Corynebacterium sp.]
MIHPANVPLGLYLNHDSPVHRLPTSAKLITVIAFLLLTGIFVNGWMGGAMAVGTVALAYAVAKVPPKVAFRQLRGAVIILVLLSLLLWWRAGGEQALTTFLALLAAIAAAILLTLTTRVSDIMDTLTAAMRPFERFGLPVDTISLALSLTLRMIPLQVMAAAEVLEARKARGATGSILAFGVPVVIRTINRSKAMGDSLIARGEGE